MPDSTSFGELEVEITRIFRRARSSQRRTVEAVHPDLDAAGYAVLVAVRDITREAGAARAVDIAEMLALHKSTTSRNLTTLADLGLIERITDPDDARARRVRLTESGASALERTIAGRREQLRLQLATWPDAEIRELARLLRQLNDTPG